MRPCPMTSLLVSKKFMKECKECGHILAIILEVMVARIACNKNNLLVIFGINDVIQHLKH